MKVAVKFPWIDLKTYRKPWLYPPNIEGQSPSRCSLQPIPEKLHRVIESKKIGHCRWFYMPWSNPWRDMFVAIKWSLTRALKRLKHIPTSLTFTWKISTKDGRVAAFFMMILCPYCSTIGRWKDSYPFWGKPRCDTLKVSIRATSNFGPRQTYPRRLPLDLTKCESLWEANPSCVLRGKGWQTLCDWWGWRAHPSCPTADPSSTGL